MPLKKCIFSGLLIFVCLFGFSCAQPAKNKPNSAAQTILNSTPEDLYGAAAAIEDLYNRRYTRNKVIHLESVLSGIAASAGFGSQMALREVLIDSGKLCLYKVFFELETKDGQKYYYGERLNRLLFDGPKGSKNVWDIVAGGAEYAGARKIPDPKEIALYNAKTIGTPVFGIPRLPKEHEPLETPLEALHATWPQVRAIEKAHHISSEHLGWVCAMAAQKVIIQKSNKIDPSLAAKIFAESAFPMSKMNPDTVLHYQPNPQAKKCVNKQPSGASQGGA